MSPTEPRIKASVSCRYTSARNDASAAAEQPGSPAAVLRRHRMGQAAAAANENCLATLAGRLIRRRPLHMRKRRTDALLSSISPDPAASCPRSKKSQRRPLDTVRSDRDRKQSLCRRRLGCLPSPTRSASQSSGAHGLGAAGSKPRTPSGRLVVLITRRPTHAFCHDRIPCPHRTGVRLTSNKTYASCRIQKSLGISTLSEAAVSLCLSTSAASFGNCQPVLNSVCAMFKKTCLLVWKASRRLGSTCLCCGPSSCR